MFFLFSPSFLLFTAQNIFFLCFELENKSFVEIFDDSVVFLVCFLFFCFVLFWLFVGVFIHCVTSLTFSAEAC